MFARITTYQGNPARLDDMTAKMDEIKGQVKAISGVLDVYSVWRADGQGVVTAIYDSQAAAEAATPQVQAIWGGLADLLMGTPKSETYDHVEHMTA